MIRGTDIVSGYQCPCPAELAVPSSDCPWLRLLAPEREYGASLAVGR
jgi:hypothetical protein